MRQLLILASFFALSLTSTSEAGPFRKSSKPDAATHVPLLLQALKESKDERVRVKAASELRDNDAKAFAVILPALTEALVTDSSTSVRSEAAESIGKIRPISIQAGYALEQCIANDKSFSVRLSAKTALVQYRLLGFLSGKTDLAVQTGEPPLAEGTSTKAPAGETVLRPTPSPVPVLGPVAPPSTQKLLVSPGSPASPGLAPKPINQTEEPPFAATTKGGPVLTSDPRKNSPVVTIPLSPGNTITPIPNIVKPERVGPLPLPPMTLPSDLGKSLPKPPAKSSEEGPRLPSPPK